MDENNVLKNGILEAVEAEGQARLADAEKQLRMSFEIEKAKIEAKKIAERQTLLTNIQAKYHVQTQQMANQERQSTLVSKQKVLQELFDAALHKMENWSEKEELDFLCQVLAKYQEASLTLILGQKTADKILSTSLETIKHSYQNLIVSEEVIEDQAGFVISHQHVDDSYLYRDLIQEVSKRQSAQFAQRIFSK